MDTAKVQLGERNVSERLLIKVEMTQTALSPKLPPAWETAQKTGNLEHTEWPAWQLTGWIVSFPDASVCLKLFPGSWSGLKVIL